MPPSEHVQIEPTETLNVSLTEYSASHADVWLSAAGSIPSLDSFEKQAVGSRNVSSHLHGCINLHMNIQQEVLWMQNLFHNSERNLSNRGQQHVPTPFISMIGNGSVDSNWITERSEMFPQTRQTTGDWNSSCSQHGCSRLDCTLSYNSYTIIRMKRVNEGEDKREMKSVRFVKWVES